MAIIRRHDSEMVPQIWRRVVLLGIIVLSGYLVLTQVKSLRPSLAIIRHARPLFVLLGVIGMMMTLFVAAVIYQLLALHKLHYRKTLLIQVASGFTNRLLPAGLGGIGLIAQYLRRQKHSTSEAITVIGMDNLIGVVGHFCLFFVAIGFSNVSSNTLSLPHISEIALLITASAALLVYSMKRVRRYLRRLLGQIARDLGRYKQHPFKLSLAICNSLLLTILYVGILWASARAVGIALSFPKVLVIFTAASIIGNATPTPGGIVGTEAGLFGGFLAYGFSGGTALAAALLYRLLTYWLPILPGVIGFWV